MIRLNQAVIVEGKYDKITLENVVDATIIVTDGFAIFKDREKCRLIRLLSEKDGIIVMTDSDSAGGMIRSYLKKICGSGRITNVYVPQLKGKERRKAVPGREGLLGVEGMSPDIIEQALKRSGVTDVCTSVRRKPVTKTDMFRLGLSGGQGSAGLRESLLRFLELPVNLSTNAMLDIINTVYGYEEFMSAVSAWRQKI